MLVSINLLTNNTMQLIFPENNLLSSKSLSKSYTVIYTHWCISTEKFTSYKYKLHQYLHVQQRYHIYINITVYISLYVCLFVYVETMANCLNLSLEFMYFSWKVVEMIVKEFTDIIFLITLEKEIPICIVIRFLFYTHRFSVIYISILHHDHHKLKQCCLYIH